MQREHSVDIDEQVDLAIAEFYLNKNKSYIQTYKENKNV